MSNLSTKSKNIAHEVKNCDIIQLTLRNLYVINLFSLTIVVKESLDSRVIQYPVWKMSIMGSNHH